MIASVTDHYADHLAPMYSWMVGDFAAACSLADQFYADLGLPDGTGRTAVDLGCGHGVHAIPLARRGYRVLALDTSSHLLGELNKVKGDLPIETISADLKDFTDVLDSKSVALIACMGDTLTHLLSLDAVNTLIRDAAAHLSSDGWLTFSFRDYSTHELKGADRFIPVRSDANRIHTCFLDYRADTVVVHDIVHALVDSEWQMSVSAYMKIRLSPESFVSTVEAHGFALVHKTSVRGMLHFAFRRTEKADAG